MTLAGRVRFPAPAGPEFSSLFGAFCLSDSFIPTTPMDPLGLRNSFFHVLITLTAANTTKSHSTPMLLLHAFSDYVLAQSWQAINGDGKLVLHRPPPVAEW